MLIISAALPVLGAIAVIVLAQTQVRERSERAALMLTIGAGLEVGYAVAGHFSDHQLLWMAGGLVHTGAVAGVVYGLMILADELHPRQPSGLPPLIASLKGEVSAVPRVVLGAFGCLAIFATEHARMQPPFAIVGALCVAGALWGSMWVDRQGPLGKWVLERRPDLVVWAYVFQLRVVNRQTGSTSVQWSARVGLATGAVVEIPVFGEQAARDMVAAVAQRCPGISLGYTADLESRFKSNPQSLRSGGAPPSFRAVG